MLPDDRFCGPNSTKWLWYDSKHSTTNLMYRTAKGIFISVAVLGYNVRVPPSLSLFMSIFSLPLSFSLSSYVCSSLADRSFSSSLNSARDTNDAFSFPFSLVVSANYFYVSLPFLRPFFGFPLALSFSDFLRRIVRRGRTQFCSSKLAVIVELYDKPTLMVKACPRRRGASLFS